MLGERLFACILGRNHEEKGNNVAYLRLKKRDLAGLEEEKFPLKVVVSSQLFYNRTNLSFKMHEQLYFCCKMEAIATHPTAAKPFYDTFFILEVAPLSTRCQGTCTPSRRNIIPKPYGLYSCCCGGPGLCGDLRVQAMHLRAANLLPIAQQNNLVPPSIYAHHVKINKL